MAAKGNPTGTPNSATHEERSNNGTNQEQSPKGRGDEQYKNIETKVNNREYFGDEYETGQDDEISSNEAKTEKANRPGRS